jgi:hypothetical protein
MFNLGCFAFKTLPMEVQKADDNPVLHLIPASSISLKHYRKYWIGSSPCIYITPGQTGLRVNGLTKNTVKVIAETG